MKQTKLEERIEEILYSDNGIPETWAGSEESIPKDKRIGKLLSLMETDRKEAVKEFVKSEGKRIALDRKKLLLGFGKDKEGDKK